MSVLRDRDAHSVSRFLAHLGERDRALADFVRRLLDADWSVAECWGPEQMDVWSLTLHRDTYAVRFGIERGIVDGVLVGPADDRSVAFRPLAYAVLGWARSHGADVPLVDPDDFRPNVATHGVGALEWLAAGNDATLERISSAWAAYRGQRYGADQRREGEWLQRTKQRGVQLIEQAAAPAVPHA